MPKVRIKVIARQSLTYALITILLLPQSALARRQDVRGPNTDTKLGTGLKPFVRVPKLLLQNNGANALVGGSAVGSDSNSKAGADAPKNGAGGGGGAHTPNPQAAGNQPVEALPPEDKSKQLVGNPEGGGGGGRDEGPGVMKNFWLPLCFFMDPDYGEAEVQQTIKTVVDLYAACDIAVEVHSTTLRKGTYSPDDPDNLNRNAQAHCNFKAFYADNSLYGAGQSHPNSRVASDFMCEKDPSVKKLIREGKKEPNVAGCAVKAGDHSIVDWKGGGGTAAHEFGHNIGRPGRGGSYLENEGEGKQISAPPNPHQIAYTTRGGVGLQLEGDPEDPSKVGQPPSDHDEGSHAEGGFTPAGCASLRGGANRNQDRKVLHYPGALESYYDKLTEVDEQLDYNGRAELFLPPNGDVFGPRTVVQSRPHQANATRENRKPAAIGKPAEIEKLNGNAHVKELSGPTVQTTAIKTQSGSSGSATIQKAEAGGKTTTTPDAPLNTTSAVGQRTTNDSALDPSGVFFGMGEFFGQASNGAAKLRDGLKGGAETGVNVDVNRSSAGREPASPRSNERLSEDEGKQISKDEGGEFKADDLGDDSSVLREGVVDAQYDTQYKGEMDALTGEARTDGTTARGERSPRQRDPSRIQRNNDSIQRTLRGQ